MNKAESRIFKMRGEKYTPYGLAKKLNAVAVLESSIQSKGRERYSLLLIDEAFRIIQEKPEELLYQEPGGTWKRIESFKGDLLDYTGRIASEFIRNPYEFPFPAGGIGFLSYEFAQFCDTMVFPPRTAELELPLAAFIFGHIYLIFDHYTDDIYLLGFNYNEKSTDLDKAFEKTKKRILDMDFNYLQEEDEDIHAEIISGKDREEQYKENVRFFKEEIFKGNLLQAVPSRRMEVKCDIEPLTAYRNLRSHNPSPYQFFLDFNNYQLMGVSPEIHVKIHEGTATIRPIAGTRRRGKNEEEDRALMKELLSDEKEKAEHLMLVDLARNDLGRVCETGSVKVTAYMDIEKYTSVMHIVSQVEGKLKEGINGADVIRATFPAGTVSGAPKIQAVNTIAKRENNPREFYAGLVGYQEPEGLNTCITIRSIMQKGDRIYFQAGGGIVKDSNPERELEETNEKMRALAKALGVEV